MTSELIIKKALSLEDVGPEAWNALLATCPDATSFQTYEWITCWWRIFNTNHKLCLYTAYRDGNLVGFAPMYLDSGILRFIGEGHSDYNVFVWHESDLLAVDKLLDSIFENNEAKVIEFAEVPEKSALANALDNRQSCKLKRLNHTPCPRLTRTEENIRRALQKKSVKRNRERLRRLGDVVVDHLSEPEDIKPYLSTFFNQHIERRSVTEHPSLFLNKKNIMFYKALVASNLPVLFSTLKINGKLIASHFGMISAGNLIWYKPAFDIQLSQYSPGEVLLSELIEYVNTNRLATIDFTRGDEDFKMRFCSEVNNNVNYKYYKISYFYDLRRLLKRSIKRARLSIIRQ